MQYRIVQDARLGLWRWILLDRGRAIARSIDAFADADSCRAALHGVFGSRLEASEESRSQSRARLPVDDDTAAEARAEDAGQFEDVGLKKLDTREPEEGEAEPSPMPQIGR